MPLESGQSLSFYEIVGPLGAGGMGEVWRARDTRLGRDVAIKVLPEALAHDADRLQRFEREARALASLSHANVAQVFGIDQVEDTCFMAMELVPGEDLSAHIARAALPLEEALEVARQIAEGLEAAHEAGVIHRDLKPANVRVMPDGSVKLLDFGLAKAVGPGADGGDATTAEPDSALLTEEGMVLGTPVYMSPEQARGRPIDRRTDLWSLGCVLYECLTGQRPFAGANPSDIIAALLKDEPDWSLLPPLPPRVDELLRRCLAKDARVRLRDAGEARVQLRLALDELASGVGVPAASPAVAGRGGVGVWLPVIGALLVGGVLGVLLGPRDEAPPTVAAPAAAAPKRLRYVLHDFEGLATLSDLAISPDGTHVAWTTRLGLHLRPLGALEPQLVAEVEGSRIQSPRWSADGEQLAWIVEDELWRAERASGVPMRVGSVDPLEGVYLLSWTRDGRLLLGQGGAVHARSIGSGEVEVLFDGGEDADFHIDAVLGLPGDAGCLVLPHPDGGSRSAVTRVRDGRMDELARFEGWDIQDMRLADGRLWLLDGQDDQYRWWWLDFDLDADVVVGEPHSTWLDMQHADFAADGTVVTAIQEGRAESQLAYVDLRGHVEVFGRRLPGMGIASPRDDGRRLLHCTVEQNGARSSVWSHDYERGVSSFLVERDAPVPWVLSLPDGRFVLADLKLKQTLVYPASGHGEPEVFSEGVVVDLTPDGRRALLVDPAGGISTPLLWDDLTDDAPAELLAEEISGGPGSARLSPDGRWVLFASDDSGEDQIYLSRFPPTGERWQVSIEGANEAFFSPEQDAIYVVDSPFMSSDRLTVQRTSFSAEPEVRLGVPEEVFDIEGRQILLRGFAPDGERLLGSVLHAPAARSLILETGWEPED